MTNDSRPPQTDLHEPTRAGFLADYEDIEPFNGVWFFARAGPGIHLCRLRVLNSFVGSVPTA